MLFQRAKTSFVICCRNHGIYNVRMSSKNAMLILCVRIFMHLSSCDVRNVRQVQKSWKEMTDGISLSLRKERCNQLMLLPNNSKTVLGLCATETRDEANSIDRLLYGRGLTGAAWMKRINQLANTYRNHYRTWIKHICRFCAPCDLKSVRAKCTLPGTFKWV